MNYQWTSIIGLSKFSSKKQVLDSQVFNILYSSNYFSSTFPLFTLWGNFDTMPFKIMLIVTNFIACHYMCKLYCICLHLYLFIYDMMSNGFLKVWKILEEIKTELIISKVCWKLIFIHSWKVFRVEKKMMTVFELLKTIFKSA